MFWRLLHSTRIILPSLYSPTQTLTGITPSQQLLAELEQAAVGGMVATRSQGHTLDNAELQESVEKLPLSARAKKRKAGHGESAIAGQAMPKRRRTSSKSEGDVAATDDSLPEQGSSPHQSKRVTGLSGKVKRAQKIDQTVRRIPTTSMGSNDNWLKGNAGEEVLLSVTVKPGGKHGSYVAAQGPQRPKDKDSMEFAALRTQRGRKMSSKESEKVDDKTLERENTLRAQQRDASNTTAISALKPTKIRFGSEEMDAREVLPSAEDKAPDVVTDPLSEVSIDSEDDAPEPVTASAGFDKVRTKSLETAKAVARHEAHQKSKRKEHDSRLKQQAKSKKKSHQYAEQSPANTTGLENNSSRVTPEKKISERQSDGKRFSKGTLPAPLPYDILSSAPVVRPLTPRPSAGKASSNQKRSFLDVDSRPPKDIKRGNVKLRVLAEDNSLLPPKASQTSKALRESWLAGHRGIKGNIMVPRRKLGGGFVRR